MDRKSQLINQKIAMTGVFGALSIVLSCTPLGYLSLGGLIVVTLMHLPVILATLIAGLVPGIATGLIFGLSSFIRATVIGTSPFFMNPLVAVLPRMLFPVCVWLFARLTGFVPKLPKVVSAAVSAALGTFMHTVMVMTMIYVLYGQMLLEGMKGALSKLGFDVAALTPLNGLFAIIGCTFVTNGFVECIVAVIVTCSVFGAMYVTAGKKSKLSKLDSDGE